MSRHAMTSRTSSSTSRPPQRRARQRDSPAYRCSTRLLHRTVPLAAVEPGATTPGPVTPSAGCESCSRTFGAFAPECRPAGRQASNPTGPAPSASGGRRRGEDVQRYLRVDEVRRETADARHRLESLGTRSDARRNRPENGGTRHGGSLYDGRGLAESAVAPEPRVRCTHSRDLHYERARVWAVSCVRGIRIRV